MPDMDISVPLLSFVLYVFCTIYLYQLLNSSSQVYHLTIAKVPVSLPWDKQEKSQ